MDKKHISEKIEEVTERAERTLVEEGAASEAAVYFEGLLREQNLPVPKGWLKQSPRKTLRPLTR